MNISIVARKAFYDKFFIKPFMPNFLRMALADGLSYNPLNNSGGAIDNFRQKEFLKLKVNSNQKSIYKEYSDIKEYGNHITSLLSIPDLIQIGAASSIQYCGGPFIDVK